jgi:hypothetical protein
LYEATGSYHATSIYTAAVMALAMVVLFFVPKKDVHDAQIHMQLEAIRKATREKEGGGPKAVVHVHPNPPRPASTDSGDEATSTVKTTPTYPTLVATPPEANPSSKLPPLATPPP